MLISINTETQTLTIDNKTYSYKKQNTVNKKQLTVADWFEKYEGVKEYDGIVATVQKWFYGTLVKSAWCATSMSYALAQLGLLKYTIGTKEDNCYNFYEKAKKCKTCIFLPLDGDFLRGDILIFKWDIGEFSPDSSKHITSVYNYTQSSEEYIPCIGGNQNDSIKVSYYHRTKLVAALRPCYNLGNTAFAGE